MKNLYTRDRFRGPVLSVTYLVAYLFRKKYEKSKQRLRTFRSMQFLLNHFFYPPPPISFGGKDRGGKKVDWGSRPSPFPLVTPLPLGQYTRFEDSIFSFQRCSNVMDTLYIICFPFWFHGKPMELLSQRARYNYRNRPSNFVVTSAGFWLFTRQYCNRYCNYGFDLLWDNDVYLNKSKLGNELQLPTPIDPKQVYPLLGFNFMKRPSYLPPLPRSLQISVKLTGGASASDSSALTRIAEKAGVTESVLGTPASPRA